MSQQLAPHNESVVRRSVGRAANGVMRAFCNSSGLPRAVQPRGGAMLIAMIHLRNAGKRRELELSALRTLCQGTADGPLLREGLKILAPYRFTDQSFQVVFETLKEMPTEERRLIREKLPARLNNRGFPDLDLDEFYQPHLLTRAEALDLLHQLAACVDKD
jgi:hypothetical protein